MTPNHRKGFPISSLECCWKHPRMYKWKTKMSFTNTLDRDWECGRIQPAQYERADLARQGRSIKNKEPDSQASPIRETEPRNKLEETKAKILGEIVGVGRSLLTKTGITGKIKASNVESELAKAVR